MNNTYTPAFLALLELGGGYFGLLGLGWILGGDILRGLLLLLGFSAFVAVGGVLTFFSFGCLAAIFVPLYIALPIISAIKVNEFAQG